LFLENSDSEEDNELPLHCSVCLLSKGKHLRYFGSQKVLEFLEEKGQVPEDCRLLSFGIFGIYLFSEAWDI
jgi:hypothetical protein